MRRLPLALLWVVVCVPLVDIRPARGQSRDEQAVRALLDRLFQANNSVDEKLAKQPLADFSAAARPLFPPFTATFGSLAEMNTEASQFLAGIAARKFATTSPVTVRVDKNLAWAAYTWRADVTFKDGTQRTFDGRATLTFAREGKNWKFVHWHASLPSALPPTGGALDAEAKKIIEVERSAWEAIKNNQPAVLADYFADEASGFYERQAYRVRGKAEIMRDVEAWLQQGVLRSYQMLDPQVQVLGDTALLTYYFTETGMSGGKEFSTAGKISIVFVKRGGAWKALHEHRSVNP